MYIIDYFILLTLLLKWQDHPKIAVIGADNMSYYIPRAQHRVVNGNIRTYTMIHTINSWQHYNDPTLFACFTGIIIEIIAFKLMILFYLATDHLFHHNHDMEQVELSVLLTADHAEQATQRAYTHAVD